MTSNALVGIRDSILDVNQLYVWPKKIMISKRHLFSLMALVALVAIVAFTAKNTTMLDWLALQQNAEVHKNSERSRHPHHQTRSAQTTPPSVESLRSRLRLAEKNKNLDAIRQKISSELRQLPAEELLKMLDEADSLDGDFLARSYFRTALFNALSGIDRGRAVEYAILAPEDKGLLYCVEGTIALWVGEDPAGFIGWVDAHRQELMGNLSIFRQAEREVIMHLLNSDLSTAKVRAKNLPQEIMKDVVNGLSSNMGALSSDQAIDFLRETLSRTDHEVAVGLACGGELYHKEEAAIQEFFRKHKTTKKEGEAILFQAAKRDMGMGLGKDPVDAFHMRMRAIAESEGFGNANEITAVILAIRSDWVHQDERYVDELLSYDPEPSALNIFLGERGNDIDAAQRARINERLQLLNDLTKH
jgi:hypothetical protein